MTLDGKPSPKWDILRDIANSLPQRDWTFDALLTKVSHPYHEKVLGTPQLRLGVTQMREFARGVSQNELWRAEVREYALVDSRTRYPGDPEKSYGIWRVFVRDSHVIYMEFSSIRVSTFHSHFMPVN
jgi:hypothetical protein